MPMQLTKWSAVACAAAAMSCSTSPPPTPAAMPQPATTKPAATVSAATLANNCFTCHGPRGRSPGVIPSLDALAAREISTKLKQFKSGELPATVMGRHAKGYSDSEIDAVAGYIAALNKK